MAKAPPRGDAAGNALAAANAVDDIVDEEIKGSLRRECRKLEAKIQHED
jgi:hypothetical protein